MARGSLFTRHPHYRRFGSHSEPSLAHWHAVVKGDNKGIGFEICKQLASNGVFVILTARNEKLGSEALHKLKELELSDAVFHQLDVTDSDSLVSLVKFVETNFGKLDILFKYGQIISIQVNNAGASGVTVNREMLHNLQHPSGKYIPNKKTREELNNVGGLQRERIDDLLKQVLTDFREDKLGAHGWPDTMAAYKISKAAINAYTRMLAKELPGFSIDCVHPGLVKTDMNVVSGFLSAEEGGRGPVMLALLTDQRCPSGLYFELVIPAPP